MILVTGTQRCGTSLMAEFLEACGYPMEGHEDEVGKFEDPDLSMEYRRILNDPSFPFDNYKVPDHPIVPLSRIKRPVAKFAFLMMDPQFVDIWAEHRGTRDRFVILVREAEKVVRSKTADPARWEQFKHDSPRLLLEPDQLKQNWFDAFCRVLNHGIQFRILKFPNFTDNYDAVYSVLHHWAGLSLVPRDSTLWRSIVDKSKITAESPLATV